MRTNFELPENLRSMAKSTKGLASELPLTELQSSTSIIPVETDLGEEFAGKILLIEEGEIECRYHGKHLLVYEAGDLLLIEPSVASKSSVHKIPGFHYTTQFATSVRVFEAETFFGKLAADHSASRQLSQIILSASQFFKTLAGELLPGGAQFAPDFRYFEPGETIIAEGDPGDEIFTMADGDAEVSIEGVVVGAIGPDEIFGAIAALTNTPRTATVTATRSCAVFAVSRENFLELVKNRPSLISKMVAGMAKTISGLNERVIRENNS
jgi:CRP/FNR family cyclic AMP-dependent transcriptional regulator